MTVTWQREKDRTWLGEVEGDDRFVCVVRGLDAWFVALVMLGGEAIHKSEHGSLTKAQDTATVAAMRATKLRERACESDDVEDDDTIEAN